MKASENPVNSIILAISLRVAYRSKRRDVSTKLTRSEAVKSIAISAAALMPILGSTWIFGIFAVNEHTEFFVWIFTILNSLQGLLIFFFYVIRQEKVRKKVKYSEFMQRFSDTVLTTLSRKNKSSTYSGETGTDLEPSKYESYKNDSVVLHHASCDDTIKSVNPPIRETSFAEPSSNFDNNCSLDSYTANKETENSLTHLDAVGEESFNTATVVCNMKANESDDD